MISKYIIMANTIYNNYNHGNGNLTRIMEHQIITFPSMLLHTHTPFQNFSSIKKSSLRQPRKWCIQALRRRNGVSRMMKTTFYRHFFFGLFFNAGTIPQKLVNRVEFVLLQ